MLGVTLGSGENAKVEVEGARLSAGKGVCETVMARHHQVVKHVAEHNCPFLVLRKKCETSVKNATVLQPLNISQLMRLSSMQKGIF